MWQKVLAKRVRDREIAKMTDSDHEKADGALFFRAPFSSLLYAFVFGN